MGRDPILKKFTLGFPDVHAVVMREVFVKDDMELADRVDKNLPTAMRDNMVAVIQVQKREAVRLAIVAIQRVPDGEWERVNDGLPFAEMDEWPDTVFTALLHCNNDLNAVKDIERFSKGAEPLLAAELLAMVGPGRGGTTARGARGASEHDGT
jgi:hypothetical protein